MGGYTPKRLFLSFRRLVFMLGSKTPTFRSFIFIRSHIPSYPTGAAAPNWIFAAWSPPSSSSLAPLGLVHPSPKCAIINILRLDIEHLDN